MAPDLSHANRADDDPEDELDASPLASRLRHMSWPEAPADVKQRVLDRILSEHPGIGAPPRAPRADNGDKPA
jgi:hypothetical protein